MFLCGNLLFTISITYQHSKARTWGFSKKTKMLTNDNKIENHQQQAIKVRFKYLGKHYYWQNISPSKDILINKHSDEQNVINQ